MLNVVYYSVGFFVLAAVCKGQLSHFITVFQDPGRLENHQVSLVDACNQG